MLLETDNLTLRSYQESDTAAAVAILSDAETMSFWPAPFTEEVVHAWIARSLASHAENGFGRCAVIHRESGRLIGDCGIMRSTIDGEPVIDLGYIFHRDYWGKG